MIVGRVIGLKWPPPPRYGDFNRGDLVGFVGVDIMVGDFVVCFLGFWLLLR
jgi:hypothetical protein